jgi:membrane protein DedA with SNARE-associated domain
VAGFLASQGMMDAWLVMLSGFTGSFCGDQIYYYIGRRYGTPLLARWPTMRKKIDWAFRLLRKYETGFILSFRFIYGIRNVSPFVIGISGVPRLRFALLNLVAALIWANAFTWGGYYLGHALESYLGQYKFHAVGFFVALAAAFGLRQWLRTRRQLRQLDRKQAAEQSVASE